MELRACGARNAAETRHGTPHREPQFYCAVALLMATTGAYTAIQFIESVVAVQERSANKQSGLSVFALLAASFSMGVNSVWVMHFINTSAVSRPGLTIQYNLWETVLSLFAILILAFVGISVAACHREGVLGNPKLSEYYILRSRAPKADAPIMTHLAYIAEQVRSSLNWQLVVGGTLLGAGVGAMHYTGVNAVRGNVRLVMDPVWVLTSVPIAAIGGIAVIWLMFHMHGLKKRLLASVILGVAVSFVHFYGYAAGTYTSLPSGEWDPDALSKELLVQAEPAVVTATLLSSVFRFLFLGVISAGSD